MNVIIYTTYCPKCRILEQKLKEKNIEYVEFTNVDEMIKKGFTTMPILQVDDIVMDFTTANKWINERN